jgi:mono/diheme cytochrome c family protein
MHKLALLPFLGAFLGVWADAPTAHADSSKVASDMGRGLAEHYCSGCHMVKPGQLATANQPGPPAFQAIANRPDTTSESLLRHLKTTHANGMIPLNMPRPGITEDERTKVISYILSLREKQ